MLRTLTLRDFVIVSALEVDLSDGLTVLTGETGAGKSILLDALGLLLGDRADPAQIRPGASRADLTAEFIPPARLQDVIAQWLNEAGLDHADEALMLRRTLEAAGRSRAWINGQPVTLTQLRELGEMLVDIHGQHAHQALQRPAAQRALFDRHAGLSDQVVSLAEAYSQWQAKLAQRNEALEKASVIAERAEQLRWKVETLRALALGPDDWAALSEEQKRLSHGAELIQAGESALQVIEEADEESLVARTARLVDRFRSLSAKDSRLGDIAELLTSAQISLEEAASALGRYLAKADLDPARLQEVEARVSQIFETARRLRARPEDLVALQAESELALAEAEESLDLGALEAQVQKAEAQYLEKAKALSKARAQAVPAFASQVSHWLKELAMGGMQFRVQLEPRDTGASHGLEDLVFALQHQAQGPTFPLAKVASGGELSRVSLAIAAVAAQATDTPTLIFDEVDVGIGGNTGHVVGRLLRELGSARQVLAVTHLPQVAARGHHHLQVSKSINAQGQIESQLRALTGDSRTDEIARMLGDEGLKTESQALARELLSL
ncbi:MAG: DNA repair protein RecN [Betaproteobacteria bacterium]|nr:DNA repair protein RecN [Betaproteobacteria bacterium]